MITYPHLQHARFQRINRLVHIRSQFRFGSIVIDIARAVDMAHAATILQRYIPYPTGTLCGRFGIADHIGEAFIFNAGDNRPIDKQSI